MIRYRIKTKQEFITEFGEKWRTHVPQSFIEEMDYLLGDEINQETISTILEGKNYLDLTNKYKHFDYDDWTISYPMLKLISPNYNDKKILVYD